LRITVIPTGWDCFICGNELEVHTTAPQGMCPCGEEGCEHEIAPWNAFEGDRVVCPECGAEGSISIVDDEAVLHYDEMSEHNTRCYEQQKGRS
jgi:DNA-directed RNA polymerase subunit RPC12/RpoP